MTETSAHDTLSLDSGAEGPDDPDGTGHHPPPSGQPGFRSIFHPAALPDTNIFCAFHRCFLLTHVLCVLTSKSRMQKIFYVSTLFKNLLPLKKCQD